MFASSLIDTPEYNVKLDACRMTEAIGKYIDTKYNNNKLRNY